MNSIVEFFFLKSYILGWRLNPDDIRRAPFDLAPVSAN